jgi:tetrahydromethanopterin S-methyltransferase subunit G
MSYPSERDNLNVHVDICAMRYEQLDRRLNNLENKMDAVTESVNAGKNTVAKVMIGTSGTIVAGILTTIVVLLMK